MSPEERRAAIVRAARPLFLEHGQATSTRLVAEAAGIAEGTVFRAFATKQDLVDAVLDAEFDPEAFKDTFHDKLAKVIEEKMKKGGKRTAPVGEKPAATTNVVDFMALLKQSLEKSGGEGRKPARAAKGRRAPAKKAATRRRGAS